MKIWMLPRVVILASLVLCILVRGADTIGARGYVSDKAEISELRSDSSINNYDYRDDRPSPNKEIRQLEDELVKSRSTNATLGIVYEILFLIAALGLLTGAAMLAMKGNKGEQIAGAAIIMVLIVSLYIFGGPWITSLVKNGGAGGTSM